MTRPVAPACLIPTFAFLALRAAAAQPASEPWVEEIAGPQYFAVLVADVDRSVDWYRTAFGLRQLDDSRAEDGSWRIVNLRNAALLVELIRDDRAQAVDRARGFFKLGFRVPDVDAVADRVQRATGERPQALDFERYGLRIIQIRDPDGNVIQLFSELGAGDRSD